MRGDPAADLGYGLVGQLHDVEMVDDQLGVRQDLPDRGLEDRAHVDRGEPHAVAPLGSALAEPVDDRLGGAALDLPEQTLPAGQVTQSDVPAVDAGTPRTRDLVEHPLRAAPADLVDTEDLNRSGLGG